MNYTNLEGLLNVKAQLGRGLHVAAILHGLADNLARELLFHLAIVLLVAFIAHNHYWNSDAIATCLFLRIVCCRRRRCCCAQMPRGAGDE